MDAPIEQPLTPKPDTPSSGESGAPSGIPSGAGETAAELNGFLAVLGAALLWSTGGAFIKTISLDAFQISFWRSLFAAATILAIMKPTRLSLDLTTVVSSLCYAAMLILFVTATKLTTAANAILLQYTAPVYILVFGYFILKARITAAQIITVALCLGGMSVFFLDEFSAELNPYAQLGNLCAVLSGLGFGLFTVLLRKKRHEHPIDAILLGNGWVIAICTGIMITHAGATEHPASPEVLYGFAISTADSVMVAFLGVFQIGIPYILLTRGIRHVPALEASLLGMLEPVLNPVWVYFFYGESPSINALIGGAIIITAVAAQSIIASRTPRLRAAPASLSK